MDDLLAVDQHSSPLTIEHIRILRLVRRSGGVAVKLPLRFKFETEAVNALCDEGLIIRGTSGWPGVPGYSITAKGTQAIANWLSSQRHRQPD